MMHPLRKLRLEKFLTQEELAKKTEVSRTSIHNIERDIHKPTGLTCAKLANFFGMDIEEFQQLLNTYKEAE